MAINDSAEIRVVDTADGSELWRGTLAQFERDNQFTDADAAALRSDLHTSGRWVVGGGAAPQYVIELVSAGWIVTSFSKSSPGRRVHTFRSAEAAQLSAIAALNTGAVVTVLGPDGEYRSVICPTSPHRAPISHAV